MGTEEDPCDVEYARVQEALKLRTCSVEFLTVEPLDKIFQMLGLGLISLGLNLGDDKY